MLKNSEIRGSGIPSGVHPWANWNPRADAAGLKALIDAILTINGAQGEVSRSDLDSAIDGTARNPTGLATMDTQFGDPDAEQLRLNYNALLTAIFRAQG
ncbi:MAG: hypothetical protein ABMA13_16485 [Chthoniobacteraceae bacterium]